VEHHKIHLGSVSEPIIKNNNWDSQTNCLSVFNLGRVFDLPHFTLGISQETALALDYGFSAQN